MRELADLSNDAAVCCMGEARLLWFGMGMLATSICMFFLRVLGALFSALLSAYGYQNGLQCNAINRKLPSKAHIEIAEIKSNSNTPVTTV